MSEDIKRVPYPEHPNRCQGMGKGNQCCFFAVEGGTNCLMHGGGKQLASIRAKNLKNYQLTMFRARLERHSGSTEIKSLRDEIGILRMIMEERLNRCKDETDLILQSGPIADLVVKIDKLVSSCHRLEGSMGELLDKTSILQFANVIISIIGDEVGDYPEVMNKVADRILVEVGKIGDDES
jgi:hypothetical protein